MAIWNAENFPTELTSRTGLKSKETQRLSNLLIALLIIGISGCHPFEKKRPSLEEIRGAVSEVIPAYLSVSEVTPEFLAGSQEGHWSINVKSILVPKTDLLGVPTAQEQQEITDIIRKERELGDWRNQFIEGKHQGDFGDMKTEMDDIDIPAFVSVRQTPKDRIPVYGRLNADWQVDRWKFSAQVDLPALGSPLSSISTTGNTPPVVLGSPQGISVIQKLKAIVAGNEELKQSMIATYDRIKKERTEKAEAERSALQTKIRSRYAPGTKFKTPYHLKDRTITAVLEVTSYNTGNDTFEAVIYDEADPSFKKCYVGMISRDDRAKEITEEGVILNAVGNNGPLPSGIGTAALFEATQNSLKFRYSETNEGLRGGVSNLFKKEDLFLKRDGK
jgi:hypothetical protein